MNPMKSRLCAVIVGFALATTGYAQFTPPAPFSAGSRAGHGPSVESRFPGRMQRGERMRSNFFSPRLVMRHQLAIGLTPDQTAALRSEVAKFVGNAVDLRWKESASREALASLLRQQKPDEKAILAEEGNLLKLRDEIKLSRLAVLIHIKSALTPEQVAKLTQIKKKEMELRMTGRERALWSHEARLHPGLGHPLGFWPGMPRLTATTPGRTSSTPQAEGQK